jgi:thiol-disulfide isomerase/thioredoxin
MRRSLFIALIFILPTVGLLAGCGTFAAPLPPLDGTEPVPPISLPTPDGDMIALNGYPGKVVFVNFWGTYCPPCVAELPALQEVYDELKGEDFIIIGLNAEEKPEKVKAFVTENGITFPIVISDDATVNAIFGLKHMPTTWFIDKNGILRGKIEGQMSKDMALKIAHKLLEE